MSHHHNHLTQEVFAKKFFSAAITSRGEISIKETDALNEIQRVSSRSVTAWIDLRTDDYELEAKTAAKALGFSEPLIAAVFKDTTSGYQDLTDELGLVLPAIYIDDLTVHVDPVIILMESSFVFTIHTSRIERFVRLRRYAETLLRKIPLDVSQDEKLTMLLIRLIDENSTRNFEKLREIEEQSDRLNEWLMNPETPISKIGPEIHKMKHALMVYLRLLWSTGDVLNTIRYADAELISDNPELLNRLSGLAQDIHSHIALTEHLSNVLTSGLEVLQSIYNNQLQAFNNRLALLMGYLTIVGTAVLVPNTLGTILSGDVFNLGKEDLWWYVTLLLGSTFASTFGVYLWVKKKGWLTQYIKSGKK